MPDTLRPRDAQDLSEIVGGAAAAATPLEVLGGGTLRALGRPVEAERLLDLSGFAGVSLYEPDELVLTDRPLQITFVLWGLSAVLVLYLAKFG